MSLVISIYLYVLHLWAGDCNSDVQLILVSYELLNYQFMNFLQISLFRFEKSNLGIGKCIPLQCWWWQTVPTFWGSPMHLHQPKHTLTIPSFAVCTIMVIMVFMVIMVIKVIMIIIKVIMGTHKKRTNLCWTWRHVKTPKVPVFTCQKMALRAPWSKNGVQKPRETPPKMVG